MKERIQERLTNGKEKIKQLWDDHWGGIVSVGVAAIVGTLGYKTLKSCKGIVVPEEAWKEHSVDSFEIELNAKFSEIDKLCKDRDIAIGVFTTFGKNANYLDGDIECFVDGTRIK